MEREGDEAARIVAAQRLEYAATIHKKIVDFLTRGARGSVDVAAIDDFHKETLGHILDWALRHTKSSIGTVLLAQDIESPERSTTELTLYASRGEFLPGSPTRWSVGEGITGTAYRSGAVARKHEHNSRYLATFGGIQDEVAVPLVWGGKEEGKTFGVLNVESQEPNHYTPEHIEWMQFLADQTVLALAALEIATKTRTEREVGKLAHRVRNRIAQMHHYDMDALLAVRAETRPDFLETIRALLGVERGSLYAAVNVYRADGSFDFAHGWLVGVAAAANAAIDSRRVSTDPHVFRLDGSMAASAREVFTTGKRLVFNTGEQRPIGYLETFGRHATAAEVQSGIVVPIFGGARIIGMLVFEDAARFGFPIDRIGIDRIELIEDVARLAAEFLVAFELRQEELQAKRLRTFDLSILSLDTGIIIDPEPPRIVQFVTEVLHTAGTMTGLSEDTGGVGQVLFVRRYPGYASDNSSDNELPPRRIERALTVWLGQDTIAADSQDEIHTTEELLQDTFDRDHPRIADTDLLEVMQTGRPSLLIDTNKEVAFQVLSPAEVARVRSWLCVPLPSPREVQGQSEPIGVLIIGTSRACRLNDSDVKALSLLSQVVVIGLEQIRLLDARTDLALDLMHDFSKGLLPLLRGVERLSEMVREQPTPQNVLEEVDAISHLVRLCLDLQRWYFDLTNERTLWVREDTERTEVRAIVQSMQQSLTTFARVLTGKDILWTYLAPGPLYIAGGRAREQHVKAALFKYIDNGLRYGGRHDVSVTIQQESWANGRWVQFAIRSRGRQLALSERPRIFERGFRGADAQARGEGSGVGLYQVKRIASALGGSVDYQTEKEDGNVFILRLPALEPDEPHTA
jgi:signal transduction histidine kinase